jgi:hypothetical protein
LQSGLVGNPSEEAGDELVGELAETEMDLLLQGGKAGGVLGELFSPELLLLLKLKVNVLKSLPSRRNGLARLATKTEEHRPASLTLFSLLSFYARGGLGSTFWVGAQLVFQGRPLGNRGGPVGTGQDGHQSDDDDTHERMLISDNWNSRPATIGIPSSSRPAVHYAVSS